MYFQQLMLLADACHLMCLVKNIQEFGMLFKHSLIKMLCDGFTVLFDNWMCCFNYFQAVWL